MPDLPDPPWRVLANVVIGEQADIPRWWIWDAGEHEFVESLCSHSHMRPSVLSVLPHPLNDPQAVAIIEAARTAQGQHNA